MAYNPFVDEEARDRFFVFEQAVIFNIWVERVRELWTKVSEQLQIGVILEGQVSFECGLWDGPLKTSLVTMWELMKPSWWPNPNAGLIWVPTAEVELEGNDDESLDDLAVILYWL